MTNGAGWTIRSATDVSDSWAIVGTGLHNGPERAILLRPYPFAVTVERTGSGYDAVTGSGSSCGTRCIARLAPGASATLARVRLWGRASFRGRARPLERAPRTRAVDGALAVRAVFARVPTPCRCAAISTTSSLQGTARTATGRVQVRLAIDWRMRCAAGTDARCEGRLHIVAARSSVRLVSPADGRVGCAGACAASGDRVVVGRVGATVEVTPPSSGSAVVTLLVQKICRVGGQFRAVGVDRVELTLLPSG